MKKNVLIIGAGAVAHVTAHKCAQNNNSLGNICIASKTLPKCDNIINSIKRKNNIQNPSLLIHSKQIDALNTNALSNLIKETNSSIIINLGTPFINMSVLDACILTKTDYIDTAIYEDPSKVCETPPWYENYEWKKKNLCKNNINAILGAGFDPGIVNAYCSSAIKHHFDSIDTIDILDVNIGNHGKYFASNFDPEINFREFTKVWSWINKQWICSPSHSTKMSFNFPIVGNQTVYLCGHDELHSLSKNINANSIRFWMGFSDHYLNVYSVLKNIGLLSHLPITVDNQQIIPLKVIKALLPDPASLAPNYTGKTCIGNLIKGKKDNLNKTIFIYNICDHKECYNEVESQAISYTAGVPAAATAILLANEIWNPKTMVNIEELNPDPFIKLVSDLGLQTQIQDFIL